MDDRVFGARRSLVMRQFRCWRRPVLLAAILALVGATLHGQGSGKLDPTLTRRVGLLFGQSNVIVTARDAVSLTTVAQVVQLAGGSLGRPLPIINACAAIVPNASLSAIAASGAVLHVAEDRLVVGADERTDATVGATSVRADFGLDGSGVTVAVIDSGITGWHDDLADPTGAVQRVDRFVDFVQQRGAPYDDYGHGTHVAGIIAGNGFDSGGARSGVAPGAHLVVLKALDGSGRGRISDVIGALDYVRAHRAELNIRVVNLSIAANVLESYTVDPLTQAAKQVVDSGVVVVAAAGNAGRDRSGKTQYGAVTAPGNAPWVLTVGASSHMGTVDRSDDVIAPFSSRGPTTVDRIAKSDVVAPGVGIESLSAPGSLLYESMSPYLLSGTVPTPTFPYLSLSGTSMSTAVVSGSVALLLQANPALTPNAVKAVLEYTAQIYPGYDALTEGAGFLNAYGAVQLARALDLPPDAPERTAAADWGRQFVWGNQRITGGQLTASSSAWNVGIAWGQATTGGGNVSWGLICTANCERVAANWDPWTANCVDAGCATLVSGSGASDNVVWRSSCGLTGCVTISFLDTLSGIVVAWSSNENGDTVVWGTNDAGDTVVWGTTCADPSCEPVVWP
jgi:serine protease AprX